MRMFVSSGYSYWGNFTPDDIGGEDIQVGGGETAMIKTSEALARRGHDITVFHDIKRPGDYNGVRYLPTNLFVPMVCQAEHEVLVGWDYTHVFRYADRAKVRICAFQLNDAQIGVYDHAIDLYMHPSQWHADRFHELYPEMSTTKIRAGVTNAVDMSKFQNGTQPTKKNPNKVMYTSSPDRGLHHLLKLWPRVQKKMPDVELHVFYDIQKWLTTDQTMVDAGLHSITGKRAAVLRELIPEVENVTFHGGVGQGRLSRELLSASLVIYPCDPVQPTEGYSMSVLEGIAAGCKVLISNADAFPELWSGAPNVTMLPLPINEDAWVETIITLLQSEPAKAIDPEQMEKKWSWDAIAEVWEKEILSCLTNTSK